MAALQEWADPCDPVRRQGAGIRRHGYPGERYKPRVESALRTPTRKIIRHVNPTYELYDLVADPKEKKDLAEAEHAALPEMTKRIEARISANEAFRSERLYENTAETFSDSIVKQLRALGYVQ